MAQKLYEESNIIAIADAIREKNGTTDTYKTSEMADAISAITTGGGGGDIEVEPIVLSGDQQYGCSGSLSGAYIDLFGDTISTEKIVNCNHMFYLNSAEKILFEVNCKSGTDISCGFMFSGCQNLKEIPKINGPCRIADRNSMFQGCFNLREIPEDIDTWFDWSATDNATSAYFGNSSSLFGNCYSLRSIPVNFIKHYNKATSSSYYSVYSTLCYDNSSLDEIVDLPVLKENVFTSNAFSNTATYCRRLQRFTFETQEDGTPYSANWKNQNLELCYNIGYGYSKNYFYNSGITTEMNVQVDGGTVEQSNERAPIIAAQYPKDWYCYDARWSRYNGYSAGQTLSTLPDVSASGGTNTIKFKAGQGIYSPVIPEGANETHSLGFEINAENLAAQIASAAERGWTVTFV